MLALALHSWFGPIFVHTHTHVMCMRISVLNCSLENLNSYLFNPNKIILVTQVKLSCHLSAPAVGTFINLTQLDVCIECM